MTDHDALARRIAYELSMAALIDPSGWTYADTLSLIAQRLREALPTSEETTTPKIPVGLREMVISDEAYEHIISILERGQKSIVEPAPMPDYTQEPRPTPEEIESVLKKLRGGLDYFRTPCDYHHDFDEDDLECVMKDAARIIEHLNQPPVHAMTPEQVERARKLIHSYDHGRFETSRSEVIQLLREVVGDE